MVVESKHPLVTLALFAYNQEQTVQAAAHSLLTQDYSPLEIILSDDASSDATFSILSEIAAGYRGPHVVRLNRNSENMGVGGHVQRIASLASGRFIFAAAGDDVSMEDRVSSCMPYFNMPEVHALSTDELHVDVSGKELGFFKREHMRDASILQFIQGEAALGCTEAWSRDVFDRFPPLQQGLLNEDVALGVRALLLGKLAYIPRATVKRTTGIGVSERRVERSIKQKRLHFHRQRELWTTVVKDLEGYGRLTDLKAAKRKLRFSSNAHALYDGCGFFAQCRMLASVQGFRELLVYFSIRLTHGMHK